MSSQRYRDQFIGYRTADCYAGLNIHANTGTDRYFDPLANGDLDACTNRDADGASDRDADGASDRDRNVDSASNGDVHPAPNGDRNH